MTTMRRGFGIRVLAGFLDAVLGIAIALPFSGTLGRWFAGRAVVTLSIGSPDTFWRGPIPMVMGIFGSFVYGLPLGLLLVLLAEALFDASPGKWLLGLSVAAADGSPAPTGNRLARWVLKCSALWGTALALAVGSCPIAVAAAVAGLVTLGGFFLAISPRAQALHDRVAGTAIYSTVRLHSGDCSQRKAH
jgi:uncharacterized RDD family membrane protein YckC